MLRILHFAMMLVLFVFTGAILFLNASQNMQPSIEIGVLRYIPAALLVVAFPVSSMFFRNTLNAAMTANKPLASKVTTYTTAHIIRMAFFETAGLFSLVVVFLTGDMINLGITGIVLAVFVARIPTAFRLENELQLTREEKEELNR